MKALKASRALFVVLVLVANGASAQQCHTMNDLYWIVGTWRSVVETTVFTETWAKGEDGALRGHAESTSTETGEIFIREKLRLENRGGVLYYVADVSTNHEEIAFRMTECTADSATFENPDHDFPKRLTYEVTGENEITAHITDLQDKGFKLIFVRE